MKHPFHPLRFRDAEHHVYYLMSLGMADAFAGAGVIDHCGGCGVSAVAIRREAKCPAS